MAAVIQPVIFVGDGLTIVHDGSQTMYNPHTESGRRALRQARESCCVEAPPHYQGRSEPFAFNADAERHLQHETKRFVIDPHTGAFVSTTSLEDVHYQKTDSQRYVDGDKTPMVAFSGDQSAACTCKLGDRVLITDTANGTQAWAVYGDNAGEQDGGLSYTGLSAAAAAALHIPLDPVTREAKQINYHLQIAVYPGSGYGNHFPRGGVPAVTK